MSSTPRRDAMSRTSGTGTPRSHGSRSMSPSASRHHHRSHSGDYQQLLGGTSPSRMVDTMRETLRDPALRSSTHPWEWRKSVKDQLSEAQKHTLSADTILNSEKKLRRSAVTTKKALDFQVNTALRKRIEETRVSKERLKAQLSRVMAEIKDLEEAKRKLEVTLHDKLSHMRVSGHCLRRRSQRPEREKVRDEGIYIFSSIFAAPARVFQFLSLHLRSRGCLSSPSFCLCMFLWCLC